MVYPMQCPGATESSYWIEPALNLSIDRQDRIERGMRLPNATPRMRMSKSVGLDWMPRATISVNDEYDGDGATNSVRLTPIPKPVLEPSCLC